LAAFHPEAAHPAVARVSARQQAGDEQMPEQGRGTNQFYAVGPFPASAPSRAFAFLSLAEKHLAVQVGDEAAENETGGTEPAMSAWATPLALRNDGSEIGPA
jgi:hypothetical protein